MKTYRISALLLTLTILIGLFSIPSSAADELVATETEIFIENEDISEETREKIIAFYTNGGEEHEGAITYGLTCTLFGHKLEGSNVKSITHKARSSAPRCLEKTYYYEACTRCDYETSTLLSSTYIYCCS